MNSTFTSIMRIVLGLALLVFGLNKFLNFIKMFEMPPAAANFMESLETTGYVFYIVAIIEISVGLMLLFKKWVPFALVLLAPLTVNILLFHLFLDVSIRASSYNLPHLFRHHLLKFQALLFYKNLSGLFFFQNMEDAM